MCIPWSICPPNFNLIDIIVFEFQGQEGVQIEGRKERTERQNKTDYNPLLLSSVN